MKAIFVQMGLVLMGLLLALMISATVYADINATLKLYNQHYYQSAAKMLRSKLVTLPSNEKDKARLTMGMVYLKNAELYQALYRTSLAANYDYMHYLVSARVKSPSVFVRLYIAKILIETGELTSASRHLRKFINVRDLPHKYRQIARANLALCYHLLDKKQDAQDLWDQVTSKDLSVQAELASSYSKSGDRKAIALRLANKIRTELVRTQSDVSVNVYYNLIDVYSRDGTVDDGLYLLDLIDLSLPIYQESLSEDKLLKYYQLSLIESIAKLYQRASEYYLKQVTGKPYSDRAAYYLGEVYYLAGNLQKEAKVTREALASPSLSIELAERARIRQAAGLYASGQQKVAMNVWDSLVKNKHIKPDQLANALSFCHHVKADCKAILDMAIKVSGEFIEKNTRYLNFSIGQYYLSNIDYDKALMYLEAARDKSQKNKIEANNPLLLVSLAEAYRGRKNYSENLQIFFEMSREFPITRQIQEAVQGIYSLEQRSAGDVKIF